MAEWVMSRAVMLQCSSLMGSGSNPGVGTVNQTVHPSGDGKLVAISIQPVTAVEDCEVQACGCTIADVWTTQPDGANYHTLVPSVRTNVLRISNC
jgi:hypothetical protein